MEDNIASTIFNESLEDQARFEPATKQQRFVNYIVDLVLYYFILYKLISVGAGLEHADVKTNMYYLADHPGMITFCAYIGLPVLYALIERVTGGRSPGKFITGTMAIKNDLLPLSGKDAVVRSLLRLVPVDPVSGLFGPPLHDKWSGTMVVKKSSLVF